MFNYLILEASQVGYLWLVISLIFLFVELSTPGLFFFITFAIGCVIAAVAAFSGYSFVIQCLALLVGFLVSFFFIKKFLGKRESKRVPTNVNALAGKKGIVLKTIQPNIGGLVKVGGEIWSAVSFDETAIDIDQKIEVVLVKGNRLVVKIFSN